MRSSIHRYYQLDKCFRSRGLAQTSHLRLGYQGNFAYFFCKHCIVYRHMNPALIIIVALDRRASDLKRLVGGLEDAGYRVLPAAT